MPGQGRLVTDWKFWAFFAVLILVAAAIILAVTTLVAPVPQ
jgi:hypothetical protein